MNNRTRILCLCCLTSILAIGTASNRAESYQKNTESRSFTNLEECHGQKYRVAWETSGAIFLEVVRYDTDKSGYLPVRSIPLQLSKYPTQKSARIIRGWLVRGSMSNQNLTCLLAFRVNQEIICYAFRTSVTIDNQQEIGDLRQEQPKKVTTILVDRRTTTYADEMPEIVALNDSVAFQGLSIVFADYPPETKGNSDSPLPPPVRLRHYRNSSFLCPPIEESQGTMLEYSTDKTSPISKPLEQ